MNLDWMNKLCADDAGRGMIGVPFNAKDHAGNRWRVATDGHQMVAVDIGDLPFPDGHKDAPDVSMYLNATAEPVWTGDLAALKERIGMLPDEQPCAQCKGEKSIVCTECDGSRTIECQCPNCDDDHYADCETCGKDGRETCPECDGTGIAGRTQIRPIRLANTTYNGNLLAMVLRDLESTTPVKVAFYSGPKSHNDFDPPVMIEGENVRRWRVLVMPIRDRPANTLTDALAG